MKIKYTILLIPFFLVYQQTLNAQDYRNAVGIRGGFSSGFTYKQIIKRNYALDIQAIYNEHGFQLNGLYEYQFSPHDKRRVFYYAGAGPYAGNFRDKIALGASAALGTEFVLRSAPLSFSAEWKPFINAFEIYDYVLFDFAIHVRLMFR